ncbi:hypothetical protein P4H67_08955 [Paenibacillus lautus]|uniref:hypothetical protein n=1 Tax=Paenibacillus lautus TaxID=1401 RepID=UPI002DBE87B8|nr:hypothetical protein [Paenibacillus lautus]MEC0306884.1 hypothetical protein [Paenibacillus lautus]
MRFESVIPFMTADSQDGYLVTPSTGFRVFDGALVPYRSSISPSLPAYLTISFPRKYFVSRYEIALGYYYAGTPALDNMATWDLEGLVNGAWIILHSGSHPNISETLTYDFPRTEVEGIRIKCKTKHGTNSWGCNEITVYQSIYEEKALVFNEGVYKTYLSGSWEDVGTSVSDHDFLSKGMDDTSLIPEPAWSTLTGDVEICFWTENPHRTEALFSIETEPFTLAEEWEDQTIKIIEYSDDPYKTESTILLETEEFDFYDEFKDTVDVLYYTDDPRKTSAELELTSNYSPLDELNGDFEIVTWTDQEDINELNIHMNASPLSQLIIQDEDFEIYGDLQSIIINKISKEGTIKLLLSFDEGQNWEYFKFNTWRLTDISNMEMVRKHAMDIDSLSHITEKEFAVKGKKIRLAYFIDDNIHWNQHTQVDNIKIVSNAPVDDAKFSNAEFYLLNTLATLQLTVGGNKLMGQLDDPDKGKVQYRVLLNNKPYYPSNGNFTPLYPAPVDIKLNISEKEILFGLNNSLTVEFQDAWGQQDTWSTIFFGTYSGLMFMDEQGQYFSDSFGGLLKHLDFDIVVAGQTTDYQKVIVKNQLGQVVQNLILEVDKDKLPPGVTIELSYTDPFIAEDYLLFNKLIQPNDEMVFYVRIATAITAPPSPNGQFEIRAKVDPV